MSFLRRILITGLALGGLLAVPSAAFAATGQPTVQRAVHTVPCTAQTFNVYHGTARLPACYAGTGAKAPHIRAVHRITTGRYWGCLVIRTGTALAFRAFHPEELIPFPRPVELMSFDLARHQVACPA